MTHSDLVANRLPDACDCGRDFGSQMGLQSTLVSALMCRIMLQGAD